MITVKLEGETVLDIHRQMRELLEGHSVPVYENEKGCPDKIKLGDIWETRSSSDVIILKIIEDDVAAPVKGRFINNDYNAPLLNYDLDGKLISFGDRHRGFGYHQPDNGFDYYGPYDLITPDKDQRSFSIPDDLKISNTITIKEELERLGLGETISFYLPENDEDDCHPWPCYYYTSIIDIVHNFPSTNTKAFSIKEIGYYVRVTRKK